MKQMSLIEMDGFLKGKCIPRDLKVNETNAEYLVRKFCELESKIALLEVQLKLSEAAERAWESSMMQACGEDGPKSVADKFAELESKLETALLECLSAGITIDNLEAKCAALAAENAAMKADHVRIFNSGYQRGHEATVEGYFVDIHQNDITTYHEDIVAEIEEEETQATDAFLAEVRAQGVEMFADHLLCPDLDDTIRDFAAQLRKGGNQ